MQNLRRACLLSGFVACESTSSNERSQSNPLGKVIELLSDLSAKVTKDGESELAAFNEYKEWCSDFSTNKKFEIETATSQSEKLQAKIVQLSSDIETGTSKIADLASDIAAGTADLKSATAIRKNEAADFATGEKELLETIDSMSRATAILSREISKNPAALTQISKSNIEGMVQSLSAVVDAASFSATDKKHLLALVQQEAGDDDAELGAPAAAAYKSHSSSILDVIEDLKDKAEAQLSDLRKAESSAKHSYAMVKQGLDDQIAVDTKGMDGEKADKAAAEEGKAGAEGDLKATVADLKSAKEALNTATANCIQVAADHEDTVASRAEELKAIAQAKEVLASTTSGASEQTYSFLQVAAEARAHTSIDQVASMVKNLARQQHSAALAQLSSRIGVVLRYGSSSSSAGPFDKVKNLIEDLIGELEQEASAEATEKAFCDEEMAKTSSKKDELSTIVSKLSTKVDQSASKSAELKSEVKELQTELATVAQDQAEMDKMRQDQNAAYVEAKADLELGLSGVRRALIVLRDYYASKEEDDDAAFVQQPAAPEKHGKAGGAASSIIGILEVVEADFATNLAKEETEEADEAEAYEKMTEQNKITKAVKGKDVEYKTQEFTALDKSVAELSSDKDTTSTELAAVLEYDAKLKDRCIAKPETYEARAKRRAAEIAGLKDALSVLEDETALVQRAGKSQRRAMRGTMLAASS